ncbi:MAG: hypothetical protein ACFFD1_12410, partial [Candidatus Thorarchaeota archaeon]
AGFDYDSNEASMVRVARRDYEKARNYYLKAYNIFATLGSDVDTSSNLINLIYISLYEKNKEKYSEYLEKLAELDKGTNQHINYIHRLGKALILKASDKIFDKAQAKEILEKLAQEQDVKEQYKIIAKLNVCDLLIFEAKAMESDEPLTEVSEIIDSLINIADRINHNQLLIEILILKSKLELINKNIDISIDVLEKAEATANSKGLIRLSKKVAKELELLDSQVEEWHKLSEKSASIFQRLEQSKLDEYIKLASELAMASS